MSEVLPYGSETVQAVRAVGNARLNANDDEQLRRLYRQFSQDTYCAGWVDPRPDVVAQFVEWATTAPCDWDGLGEKKGTT